MILVKILETYQSGENKLDVLFQPLENKIAYRTLKKLGWREGQGIGKRRTRKEKKETAKRCKTEQYQICIYEQSNKLSSSDDEFSSTVKFAPDDCMTIDFSLKSDTFGLGYSFKKLTSLEKPSNRTEQVLLIKDHKSKKSFQIKGQAFGVGAFEDEDEDIYDKNDFSYYDFSLEESTKYSGFEKKLCSEKFSSFVKSKTNINFYGKISNILNLPTNYHPKIFMKNEATKENLEKNICSYTVTERVHAALKHGFEENLDTFNR